MTEVTGSGPKYRLSKDAGTPSMSRKTSPGTRDRQPFHAGSGRPSRSVSSVSANLIDYPSSRLTLNLHVLAALLMTSPGDLSLGFCGAQSHILGGLFRRRDSFVGRAMRPGSGHSIRQMSIEFGHREIRLTDRCEAFEQGE
jgi:hypothetical protein